MNQESPTNSEKVEYDILESKSCEYKTDCNSSVKGRLKHKIQFWRDTLKVNSFIDSVIVEGYKIPFLDEPSSIFCKNNASALKHPEFVKRAISDLLSKNCIEEVKSPPYCVNPLTVSVNSSGKERLILDLRHVNQNVMKFKVKFENHTHALNYCQVGNFMFKFDLKSGYHHVDIHRDYQKFLGFSWYDGEKVRFYVFTVLPFGLSSAPFLFTKLLRPMVKYWRGLGYSIVVYLDDGWGTDSPDYCHVICKNVRRDLALAGFLANEEKSIWVPCFELEWLGYCWNLRKGSIEIPERKFVGLKSLLYEVLNGKTLCSARVLAKVVGNIISMAFSLGNICHIMTRNLHVPIVHRRSWDSVLHLDAVCRSELQFWLNHLNCLPFRSITPLSRLPERILFVDASDFAGAGVLLSSSNQISHVMFQGYECVQSSTFRELRALQHALSSFRKILSGKFVKVYTDNQNVVRICSTGSSKVDLQIIARAIFQFCVNNDIIMEVAWVPRDINLEADLYSKCYDSDDWAVSDVVFHFLDKKWGPHVFDRFADSQNSKLLQFNSRFWCPGTSGVDAFAFDWSQVNNWLVPPVHLIPRTLSHLLACKAKGTLIVPRWESSVFWPILINSLNCQFKSFVVDYLEYKRPKQFFVPGSDKTGVFAVSPFNGNVLVLRIDMSV